MTEVRNYILPLLYYLKFETMGTMMVATLSYRVYSQIPSAYYSPDTKRDLIVYRMNE